MQRTKTACCNTVLDIRTTSLGKVLNPLASNDELLIEISIEGWMMTTTIVFMAAAMLVGDVDVAVTLKDRKVLVGSTSLRLEMKTGFGAATVDEDKVESIKFGDPDQVTTSDGTVLKGTSGIERLKLRTDDGVVDVPRDKLVSLGVIRRAAIEPGQITSGAAANQMTYYLRVPKEYDSKKPASALVVFHGSNMNSKMYLQTIISRWPSIAKQYILVGINGERRNANSPADNPTFNYTYVNFAGKSKYKGYPGTDRESPALVVEVVREIQKYVSINKVFVGGHSQGGFLTYSVVMNYPDLFDGAFPVSGGAIVQAEPKAYDNEPLRKQQRRIPFAIVHGETDPAVQFRLSRHAYESFTDDGFPMVRLFKHKSAGHRFALLPIDQAIDWLARMTSDDPRELLDFAEQRLANEQFRDAVAALRRADQLDADENHRDKLNAIKARINEIVEPQAKKFAELISDNNDNTWVDAFLEFRRKFEFADGARAVVAAYYKLRKKHQKGADDLYHAARRDFRSKKQDDAYAKYQQVVDKYYASSWYPRMKRWIAERK